MSDDLLVKYLLNEASEEEKEVVEQWLGESEANTTYFRQLRSVWEESRKIAATTEIDEEGAWQRFKTKIHAPIEKAKIKRINRFGWMRAAAILIIVISAGLLIYNLNREPAVETLTASSGNAVLNDTLPDGSIVTLNKNSSLTYPDRFKEKTRSVSLQGEAFFNVTPNKEKPFSIEVNDIVVKVVGTSFNIRSESETTEVIVETGIVQVTHKGRTVELKPGDKLLVPAKDTALVVQKETGRLYDYYRSKEFVCENTPLWKLVDVLNKAYDANIVIERQELKGLHLNTTFSNEPVDRILEIISLTFNTYNIKIEKKEDRIILR